MRCGSSANKRVEDELSSPAPIRLRLSDFASVTSTTFNAEMLDFIRDFGLILFVYTIGIQVGPASSRRCAAQAGAERAGPADGSVGILVT